MREIWGTAMFALGLKTAQGGSHKKDVQNL